MVKGKNRALMATDPAEKGGLDRPTLEACLAAIRTAAASNNAEEAGRAAAEAAVVALMGGG